MGEIVVDVELENLSDRNLCDRGFLAEEEVRRIRLPAVADTGAIMLALPELVEQLGIDEVGAINTTYADGRRGELPVAGGLAVHIGDRSERSPGAIELPQGSDPLIGQVSHGRSWT